MTITIWIVQCLLGLLFIITGSFKFFQSKEKVIASGGTWASDFKAGTVKLIAGTELVCALLVLVPKLAGRWNGVAHVGATCIAIIMAGAIYTHIRRKEYSHAIINVVFLLMAAFVSYVNKPC